MSLHPASASPTTVLYIKYMVCPRGIRVVRQELQGIGLQVLDVCLGAATVAGRPEELDWPRLRATLEAAKFALLETFHQTLVERVSVTVNHLLREPTESLRHRAFGAAVAHELGMTYRQLCPAFTRLIGGKTLADYILSQRLAYAQELLASTSLGVGLIARRLGYASLAHFSGQFRRVTRCSPSTYRKLLRNEKPTLATDFPPNDASERR